MTTLGKRLDALEQISERCRIREMRGALGEEIVRRSREHGVTIPPHEIEAKVDRALAIAETASTLLASGYTLEGVAQHLAAQHELDPARVLALYRELRAQRPAS